MEALKTTGGQDTNGFICEMNSGLVRVNATLRNVTPLLMNAMSAETLLDIRDKERKKAKNRQKPTVREEAESKLHLMPDGQPHVPVNALFGAMMNAGVFVRLDGKRQVSTKTESHLPGLMTIDSLWLPLLNPGTEEAATWEVDIAQGRNPNGGEAVCIVRPRFDVWEIRVVFQVDLSRFPMLSARKVVELAGSSSGLLDHRPQKKGTFGRFGIVRWEEGAS